MSYLSTTGGIRNLLSCSHGSYPLYRIDRFKRFVERVDLLIGKTDVLDALLDKKHGKRGRGLSDV